MLYEILFMNREGVSASASVICFVLFTNLAKLIILVTLTVDSFEFYGSSSYLGIEGKEWNIEATFLFPTATLINDATQLSVD